jgi:hypothetical protein
MRVLSLIFLLGVVSTRAASLDVTDRPFGAVPDDGKDDSAAIQLAINQALRQGDGEVFVPPGEYHIGHRLRIEGRFDRLFFRGAGHGLVRFVSTAEDGFVVVKATLPTARVGFLDFDLYAGREAGGTAFHLVKPYAETSDGEPSLVLSGLMLRPVDITRDYFVRTIHAEGWSPLIENVNASGPYGPKVQIEQKGIPESVVVLKQAWRPRIRYCHFWSAATGVEIELTDAHEQPTFEGSVSVECGRGIVISKIGDNDLSHPVVIRDSHWNNWEVGLHLRGIHGFLIENNVPYFPRADMDSAQYHDILLENSSRGLVRCNQFWFPGSSRRSSIRVDPACRDIRITRNYFGGGVCDDAIVVAPGARNVVVTGNDYGGLYAMDEPATFAIWEFDDPEHPGRDKSLLEPDRRNTLQIIGTQSVEGGGKAPGRALDFSPPGSRALSSHGWPAAPGVDLRLLVRFYPARGERTVLEVPGAFRLLARERDLVFEATGSDGNTRSALVPRGAVPNRFLHVRCLASPEVGRLLLEIDGVGRDETKFPAPLARSQELMTLAPDSAGEPFTGALDQIRVLTAE